MERRVYHGNLSATALADHLVATFDPQENLQAQRFGEGGTSAVQIGRGDVPEELRHAATVAITPLDEEGQSGITVTLGQQQWLTPKMATYAATIGLVSLLVTPWALFAMLWPVSELMGSMSLPDNIWNEIDHYVMAHGGQFDHTEELKHPHSA